MVNHSDQTSDRVCCLYQSLVQHRIHQDQLLWSRVQIVHAVQAGVLAGAFALNFAWHYSFFAGLLLVIGGLLTFLLFFLVKRDYADHIVNADIMDKLAKRLLPFDMKNGKVKWTAKRRFLRGHQMIYCSIIGFTVLDFVLGVSLLCSSSIFG